MAEAGIRMPEVGEIWKWEAGNPLLLLEVVGTYPKKSAVEFLCLDLVRNLKYAMTFAPLINNRWTRLA